MNLLNGIELPQAILDRISHMTVLACEHKQVVLLLLVVEEVLQFARRHLAIWLNDN